MSLFDKIKNQAAGAAGQATTNITNTSKGGSKSVQVTFGSMPETLTEFTALPQAAMANPFDTAALCVAALCVYPLDKDATAAMLNHLRGPRPLGNPDIRFLAERMAQNNKAGYLGASYLDGATPQNEYSPSEPFTVTVSENPYSYVNDGYATLYIKSGGADSPRPVTIRQAKDGRWYLWEYPGLLVDILSPESSNPWATRGFI